MGKRSATIHRMVNDVRLSESVTVCEDEIKWGAMAMR